MKLLSTAAATAAIFMTGCSVSNVNVVNDHRLHFVTPADRAHVHVPVEIRWTVSGYTAVAPGAGNPTSSRGYFALFMDRPPVGPGESLNVVANRDVSCKRTPGCPDAMYFADRQIYTTRRNSFVLDHVANLLGNREKEQMHEVTVVLLDTAGRRIGESAWYLDLWLPQAGATS